MIELASRKIRDPYQIFDFLIASCREFNGINFRKLDPNSPIFLRAVAVKLRSSQTFTIQYKMDASINKLLNNNVRTVTVAIMKILSKRSRKLSYV